MNNKREGIDPAAFLYCYLPDHTLRPSFVEHNGNYFAISVVMDSGMWITYKDWVAVWLKIPSSVPDA